MQDLTFEKAAADRFVRRLVLLKRSFVAPCRPRKVTIKVQAFPVKRICQMICLSRVFVLAVVRRVRQKWRISALVHSRDMVACQ